jgi:hypothetical protein
MFIISVLDDIVVLELLHWAMQKAFKFIRRGPVGSHELADLIFLLCLVMLNKFHGRSSSVPT